MLRTIAGAWRSAIALLAFSTLVLGAGLAMADAPMTADDARSKALAGEIVLVDIRTPGEWAQTGLPDAAHALDMQDPGFLDKLGALAQANAGKPIALICATGGRTRYVIDALERQGAAGLIDVSEGMMGSGAGPGWIARGLPVRTPNEPPTECESC